MKNIIETLYPMNRYLLGAGYDNALEFLKHLIKLDILEFPSGMELGTWTVPDEWVIRDAWVKDPNGNKICDYKENPMCLVVGSLPFNGKVDKEELRKHWHYSDERPDAIPYVFKYYDKDWGFCFPKNQILEEVFSLEKDDSGFTKSIKDKVPDGEYEVFIDSEYKQGTMKIGVHTIPGDEKEILLFAHLDHPFQANDNLSGVACLVDLANKIKSKHTIKIVFCPETIGSIAYALTQDIKNVLFMIAVDICGNDNDLTLQMSWNREHRINRIAHLAIQGMGKPFKKGQFRGTIGSDEYAFNDPLIDIQGIMLSRFPYPQYHTSDDKTDTINYDKIEETQKAILKIIEYWEKDFIPERKFKGQLMRSRYGIQASNPQFNLSWDYFIYSMDGKKYVSELCADFGLNFEFTMDILEKMYEDNKIGRIDDSQRAIKQTTRKKQKRI